ncbi:MAG: hypothetical protein WCD31_14010 [Gillisia sp.]
MKKTDSVTYRNKIIPPTILKEAEIALSYYPELKDTPITLKFKDNIKKSYMQAQPKFSGIFNKRKKRSYFILISKSFDIDGKKMEITDIPAEVLIGWIGHEFGHIVDYKRRKGFNLIIFALKYLTSNRFIREAERAADTYAVNHGMGDYILATKDFILNQANLTPEYKERIKRLYLSPEEIMELVHELKEKKEHNKSKSKKEVEENVIRKKELKETPH